MKFFLKYDQWKSQFLLPSACPTHSSFQFQMNVFSFYDYKIANMEWLWKNWAIFSKNNSFTIDKKMKLSYGIFVYISTFSLILNSSIAQSNVGKDLMYSMQAVNREIYRNCRDHWIAQNRGFLELHDNFQHRYTYCR